jgi:hypothetical protein
MENISPLANQFGVTPTTKPIALKTFIERFTTYDLDAPYQRDKCWPVQFEQKLIISVLSGIPIGTVHLVMKEDGMSQWVLDAKQRTNAIQRFYQNEYSIEIELGGKKEMVKYRDMPGHADPRVRALVHAFQDATLSVVCWPYMNILKQSEIFQQINSMATLNTNEEIYCPRFLAKDVINYFYQNAMSPILKHLKNPIRRNKRFAGTRMMHQILLSLNSTAFGVADFRHLRKDAIIQSAQYIHNTTLSVMNEKVPAINECVIDSLGLGGILSDVRKAVDCLKIVLDYSSVLPKQLSAPDLQDIIYGFNKKIKTRQISSSFVISHTREFAEMIAAFVKQKAEQHFGEKTLDKGRLDQRAELFDNVFDRHIIDKGEKNVSASGLQKTLAYMTAGSNCEICGRAITEENAAVDHVAPKAKASETVFKVICKHCNRSKSDLTTDELRDISCYVEKATSL